MRKKLIHSQSGQALLIAMGILSILSLIAVATLASVSARYKTALRTAAWEESLLAAESGVDMTIAQVAALLPNVTLSNNGLSLGGVTPDPALLNLLLQPGGLSLNNGVSLSLTMPPLVHGGQGATTSTAKVTLDVLPLNQVLSGNLLSNLTGLLSGNQTSSISLLRLRSTGTVYLPGTSRTGEVEKLDSDLLRMALVRDPSTGNPVSQPFVSRQVEVLLKPMFPFENGVATQNGINAPSGSSNFDSFNSASPLSSTNGLYDSTKARSDITVDSNSPTVTLGGTVFGNVSTDGGNLVKTAQITGTVNNSYFRPLPTVNAPTWTVNPTTANGTTTVTGGTLLAPTQTKFNSVTGTLHVSGPLGGLGGLLGQIPIVGSVVSSEADIYVTGDFTGNIIVDPGTKVRLYVQGNVTMGTNALQNNSQRASELQIIGIPPSDGTTRTISIDTTNGPIASIYAPTHNVTLTGAGSLSGSVSAALLTIPGSAAVHYDEELALEPGLVLGYELVSWQEILP
jgi:cytoskeletal protein CcmA (bactofilin family)